VKVLSGKRMCRVLEQRGWTLARIKRHPVRRQIEARLPPSDSHLLLPHFGHTLPTPLQLTHCFPSLTPLPWQVGHLTLYLLHA